MTCLISSYEAPFSIRQVRSTTETSEVGTRKDIPVSLPFNEGMTLPTACQSVKRRRQHDRTYLGGTGRRGDDVGSSATASTPVLWNISIRIFLVGDRH